MSPITILKKSRLSVTHPRISILELFVNSKTALTHGNIENETHGQFDRVTVYRTLQCFLEKGIIHNIPTTDNSIQYALCKDDCHDGHHHDHHVHLVCDDCNTTYCLDDIVTPTIHLPNTITMRHMEVVIKGTCEDCTKKP